MLRIEKTDVFGWEAAIRGMRNPMNSWDKSDSYYTHIEDAETEQTAPFEFFIGENDLSLMRKLSASGNDHGKFMRMINVTADITAPLSWWKEYDTYKVGTVANSCSTMHKIHAKEFTLDDFSHEHLFSIYGKAKDKPSAFDAINETIHALNYCRENYLETNQKEWWYMMIQLLPTSYNQKRTIQLNYQVLKAIYPSRKNHKLDEWHTFCNWIEDLPYSELITGAD